MTGCFTKIPRGDVVVSEHMDMISTFLKERLGNSLVSLILVGSYGRGEGSLLVKDNGSFEVVNDYDFVVVLKDTAEIPSRITLANWEKGCSLITGMRWIDFEIVFAGQLSQLRPTQANYDLKYGGRVIWGDTNIISNIPSFQAKNIPLRDAQVLLNTRFWCFIGTRPLEIVKRGNLIIGSERVFILQQLSKALIAVGDSALLFIGKYKVQYSEKAKCITSLSQFSERARALIIWGYEYKLGETRMTPEGYELSNLFLAALDLHLESWKNLQKKIPFLRSINTYRLYAGIRQLVQSRSCDGIYRFLLDCIQLRFLFQIQKKPDNNNVDLIGSFLLWLHCKRWISRTSEYATKTAELRLG